MPSRGYVLGPALRSLATELAGLYVQGELVIVAGAGVSRASGLPGWSDMVETLESITNASLGYARAGTDLDAVLETIHGSDPIGRADSIRRLLKGEFPSSLHIALFGDSPATNPYRPSISHWHLASLVNPRMMRDLFTSNYDDLLEDAKLALNRGGRVRHFHGRLPQSWSRATRLGDTPVVTTRDYMVAETQGRYERIATAFADKTALLVGFSLSDPNLARIIRDRARDCRALLIASPGRLSQEEQRLRLDLLKRYWQGLNEAP